MIMMMWDPSYLDGTHLGGDFEGGNDRTLDQKANWKKMGEIKKGHEI